ncbi:MAG: ATP synthase F1 subunit delta [Planctomycetia bacterium]|nr:ATP synthase F1 subunit delta [Planctomycetia bacterium]
MSNDIQTSDSQFAAEFNPDVSVEKIAGIYADALIGAVDNNLAQVKEILDEYAQMIQSALDKFPQFEKILGSRLIPAEEKAGIIERTLGGALSQVLLNFFRVLARHERLDCIRAIYAELWKKYDKLAGRIPVVITTAAPIAQDVVDKIAQDLRNFFAGDLLITCKVDPNQIGGLVVRVGDTIYDGSVATQLENIRRNIVKNYAPKQ